MRARAPWVVFALCAALAACAKEDPVPGLEAERAQLMASTVPRDDYWKEVGRKGEAIRAQHSAEQRSKNAATERAPVLAAISQLRTAVADAQKVNADITTQIAALDQQTEKVRARGRELEAYLARTGPPDVGAPGP